jgi:UDP-hydrolysing UDP-N-acetyl-D-glucosamine 2-epimerase
VAIAARRLEGLGRRLSKRRIAVLSTGRQDWGILRELCRLLSAAEEFDLSLMLGGMHCSRHFGSTAKLIKEEGFEPREHLNWIADGADDPEQQAGDAIPLIARALAHEQPEAMIIVGDRFETLSAAFAATLVRVPIIHLHGGERTAGAMDNAFREAITKLSHLHFTSHPQHTARIIEMGEDPATVHTVGAPGLDNLRRLDLPDRRSLEDSLKFHLSPPVVLVTVHPATLASDVCADALAVTRGMDRVDATYIITLPNTDPGSGDIRNIMRSAALGKPKRKVFEAVGERAYWGLMRLADAMLGNSSSAIIEAPLLGLPAVNVGIRQAGRVRGANVIDAPADAILVEHALTRSLSAEFRELARQAGSPFGCGDASRKILEVLRKWTPPRPPAKREFSSGCLKP